MTHRRAGTQSGRLLAFLLWISAPALLGRDRAAAVEERIKGNGYEYTHEVVPETPWSIHVFKFSRADPGLEFETTIGDGRVFRLETVSDQLRTAPGLPGRTLAAVNGDFYQKRPGFEGRPRDLQISGGEILTQPAGHAAFWVDTNGAPQMTNVISLFKVVWEDGSATPLGLNEERAADAAVLYTAVAGGSTHSAGGVELELEPAGTGPWLPLKPQTHYTARVREVSARGDTTVPRDGLVLSLGPKLAPLLPPVKTGSVVRFTTDTFPSLAGVRVAIGGGPALVHKGKTMAWEGVLFRHPRTALGWNKGSYYLVEVDGRQRGLSLGMTFPELSGYLAGLGCEEALNLDGGGSATLWALGKVRNSPSEGRERPCPNALVVLQKQAAGSPASP